MAMAGTNNAEAAAVADFPEADEVTGADSVASLSGMDLLEARRRPVKTAFAPINYQASASP